MRREYVSCLGRQCVLDEDEYDTGYSRLDSSNHDSITMVEGNRRTTQDDYFRSPDSYQWNPADNDQGQEPRVIDQGSHSYSGVSVHAKKDKPKKRSLPKRIRHFFRVSFKWIRRGFVTASPAVTPQLVMNPAMIMNKHIQAAAHEDPNKPMVFL